MKISDGGVCAAKGFSANGVHCGIRKNKIKKDLSLIVSEVTASCAAVYTTNAVFGAPITVTRSHLENGKAKACICNSGIANTCCAGGVETANEICLAAAEVLGCKAEDIVIASTGVIGQPLDPAPIKAALPALAAGLNENGSEAAAAGIMTTDTVKKEIAVEFELGGKTCHIGGIAKGSGMIHINMGTTLSFVTTDAAISSEMLKSALIEAADVSYNMVSVDGDTSTNDTLAIMASGYAGNKEITEKNDDYKTFTAVLTDAFKKVAKKLAKDGEGATKLLICKVDGAKDDKSAKIISKSIICSSLVKAAMFGADANCGRILCAIGYSGAETDVKKIDVSYKSAKGEILVCKDGNGLVFDEDKAKEILLEDEIEILVKLGDGNASAEAYGCDLTYDYVKINGDYRT